MAFLAQIVRAPWQWTISKCASLNLGKNCWNFYCDQMQCIHKLLHKLGAWGSSNDLFRNRCMYNHSRLKNILVTCLIRMRFRGFVCTLKVYTHTIRTKKLRKYTGPDVVLQRVKLDAPIQVTLHKNKCIASFCQLFLKSSKWIKFYCTQINLQNYHFLFTLISHESRLQSLQRFRLQKLKNRDDRQRHLLFSFEASFS